MQKVSDFIDIQAPCEEVFKTIEEVERRMQLSPLWGLNKLLEISTDFPKPGSNYRVRVLTDAPFGIAGGGEATVNNALAGLAQVMTLKMGHELMQPEAETALPTQEAKKAEEPTASPVEPDQKYFIQVYEPPYRLSYALDADCHTVITWKLQSIPRGTRLSYEELFCPEMNSGEDFLPTVRHVIREWLLNIKRYNELRGSRFRILLKRLLDRFFLRLRPDQRRTVLLILVMQGLALAVFAIGALSLAIASLLI
jgi:hypothetical protein